MCVCVLQVSKLYVLYSDFFSDDDKKKLIRSDLCKAHLSTSQEFRDELFGNSAVSADGRRLQIQ